jgi:hypothetical protein
MSADQLRGENQLFFWDFSSPAALLPVLIEVGHLPVGVLVNHEVSGPQETAPPHLFHVQRVPDNQSFHLVIS